MMKDKTEHKISATLNAYVRSAWRLQSFRDHMQRGDQTEAVDAMVFCAGDCDHLDGWTRVGEAEISVTLRPADEVTASMVQALRAQLDAERAKFMQRQSEILEQINKLSALEYVEAA